MLEDLSPQEQAQNDLYDWLQQLDLETPLAELIADHPEWMETPELDPHELERLDTLAHEYAQELADHDLLPSFDVMEHETPFVERTPDHTDSLDFEH